MQFFALAALVTAIMAAPADNVVRNNGVCSGGLYSNPQCCTPDVLGVACLDSAVPYEQPLDAQHFREICGKVGKGAKCCVVPIAGQDALCKDGI